MKSIKKIFLVVFSVFCLQKTQISIASSTNVLADIKSVEEAPSEYTMEEAKKAFPGQLPTTPVSYNVGEYVILRKKIGNQDVPYIWDKDKERWIKKSPPPAGMPIAAIPTKLLAPAAGIPKKPEVAVAFPGSAENAPLTISENEAVQWGINFYNIYQNQNINFNDGTVALYEWTGKNWQRFSPAPLTPKPLASQQQIKSDIDIKHTIQATMQKRYKTEADKEITTLKMIKKAAESIKKQPVGVEKTKRSLAAMFERDIKDHLQITKSTPIRDKPSALNILVDQIKKFDTAIANNNEKESAVTYQALINLLDTIIKTITNPPVPISKPEPKPIKPASSSIKTKLAARKQEFMRKAALKRPASSSARTKLEPIAENETLDETEIGELENYIKFANEEINKVYRNEIAYDPIHVTYDVKKFTNAMKNRIDLLQDFQDHFLKKYKTLFEKHTIYLNYFSHFFALVKQNMAKLQTNPEEKLATAYNAYGLSKFGLETAVKIITRTLKEQEALRSKQGLKTRAPAPIPAAKAPDLKAAGEKTAQIPQRSIRAVPAKLSKLYQEFTDEFNKKYLKALDAKDRGAMRASAEKLVSAYGKLSADERKQVDQLLFIFDSVKDIDVLRQQAKSE